MAHMTKTGRVYERGRTLNNDLRRNIIQDIVENGGDFVTVIFPKLLWKIEKNTTRLKKIWKEFCESGTTKFQGQAGGSKHLQPDDIELIRFLKTSTYSVGLMVSFMRTRLMVQVIQWPFWVFWKSLEMFFSQTASHRTIRWLRWSHYYGQRTNWP